MTSRCRPWCGASAASRRASQRFHSAGPLRLLALGPTARERRDWTARPWSRWAATRGKDGCVRRGGGRTARTFCAALHPISRRPCRCREWRRTGGGRVTKRLQSATLCGCTVWPKASAQDSPAAQQPSSRHAASLMVRLGMRRTRRSGWHACSVPAGYAEASSRSEAEGSRPPDKLDTLAIVHHLISASQATARHSSTAAWGGRAPARRRSGRRALWDACPGRVDGMGKGSEDGLESSLESAGESDGEPGQDGRRRQAHA
jgi:hypothetical protein